MAPTGWSAFAIILALSNKPEVSVNWEAIGAVGEMLGALGVIVTLIYLATQIRQNTGAVRSQTRATIFSGLQEELWKNMEFPDVTLNLKNGDRALTPEERIRLMLG